MNYKNIFYLDTVGAFFSTLGLMILKKFLSNYFGFSEYAYLILIGMGVLLFLYSCLCSFILIKTKNHLIKLLPILNILYCAISCLCIFVFIDNISLWGIIYFSLEIWIILTLVYFEFKVIKNFNPNVV